MRGDKKRLDCALRLLSQMAQSPSPASVQRFHNFLGPEFPADPYFEGYEDQDAAVLRQTAAQEREHQRMGRYSRLDDLHLVRNVQVTPTPQSSQMPSLCSLIRVYKIYPEAAHRTKATKEAIKTKQYHSIGLEQELSGHRNLDVVQYEMIFALDKQFVRNKCYRRSTFEFQ